MSETFESLVEKKIVEEKKAIVRRMIVGGKLTVEEIAEYVDLPIEEVRD